MPRLRLHTAGHLYSSLCCLSLCPSIHSGHLSLSSIGRPVSIWCLHHRHASGCSNLHHCPSGRDIFCKMHSGIAPYPVWLSLYVRLLFVLKRLLNCTGYYQACCFLYARIKDNLSPLISEF